MNQPRQDFTDIEYLRNGSLRQQEVFRVLQSVNIFEDLRLYQPVLTGTFPIGIDINSSDLDIICSCGDHQQFSQQLQRLYGSFKDFSLKSKLWQGRPTTIANFEYKTYAIEIFAQAVATVEQNAYRHMIIENQILQRKGADFRAEIIALKKSGLKTEPAFAKLLGLKGDPYEALLKFQI
ncbi:DUF4269 domain-containing protein [Persicobacter psychrovividus]|uniref:Alpha/beta hydrolase n=1 Tax=Persicobacter psychrovividus TaxID=387638 RepID=A0ABN6L4S8_9BACT|nr:alpha/beta hydrolase [Persicobacter psychrovividus]